MADNKDDFTGGTIAELMAAEVEILQPDEQTDKQVNLSSDKQVNKLTRKHVNKREDNIEVIRKAVKQVGKELSGYRFTAEEKESLTDIVYNLKKQGIKTSESEIVRIALNHILNDYEDNAEQSILAIVLERLNA